MMRTPKPTQKTLNGRNAPTVANALEAMGRVMVDIASTLHSIDLNLRELPGSKQVISSQSAVSPFPTRQVAAGELPPDLAGMSELAQEWLVPLGSGYAMKHYTHDRELWSSLNEEMNRKGLKWVSDKKNSRWE